MRVALILAMACLALAGCKREPSFDERYDAANKTIAKTAHEIDAEITGSPAPVDPVEPGDDTKGV